LPVIAHFINNAFAVIYYHFSGSNIGESKIDYLGRTEADFIILVLSFSILILVILLLFKFERLKTNRN
jgi:hypothetical protein